MTAAPFANPVPPVPTAPWDPAAIAGDFPMLARSIRGSRLSYLDNAATALKPSVVVDAMAEYYNQYTANVARGVHTASQEATTRFEAVRDGVAAWIGARESREVVFTSGTTAAINLVAQSYARPRLRPGDEILVSEMEHHSNLVPWHLVAEQTGAHVRGIPITDRGELNLAALASFFSVRTRIVALCHASNVLGTIVPLADIAAIARSYGAVLVVDGAQAVPHLAVDVQALGCDFYAFSAHKVFGPTGLGVLYGRAELLESMPPWQGGGGMIGSVEIDRSTFAPPPARFEAGTPAIAEVLGFGAAIEYVGRWDRAAVLAHEDELAREATARLSAIPGVRCFGSSAKKVAVVSFTVDGIHPHDVGTALDATGVAVRAGHHCAQPLMRRLRVGSTVRASFAPYNTSLDVDALVAGVNSARAVFGQ